MYDWLGVDKVELAVMAELTCRRSDRRRTPRPGRPHGANRRFERPAVVLDSLKTKQLVIPLTPEGRGHVITHNLYQPRAG